MVQSLYLPFVHAATPPIETFHTTYCDPIVLRRNTRILIALNTLLYTSLGFTHALIAFSSFIPAALFGMANLIAPLTVTSRRSNFNMNHHSRLLDNISLQFRRVANITNSLSHAHVGEVLIDTEASSTHFSLAYKVAPNHALTFTLPKNPDVKDQNYAASQAIKDWANSSATTITSTNHNDDTFHLRRIFDNPDSAIKLHYHNQVVVSFTKGSVKALLAGVSLFFIITLALSPPTAIFLPVIGIAVLILMTVSGAVKALNTPSPAAFKIQPTHQPNTSTKTISVNDDHPQPSPPRSCPPKAAPVSINKTPTTNLWRQKPNFLQSLQTSVLPQAAAPAA